MVKMVPMSMDLF